MSKEVAVTGTRLASNGSVNGYSQQHTYYVRDAQGNLLAVYTQAEEDNAPQEIVLREQPLYGSTRLGERQPELPLPGGPVVVVASTPYATRVIGLKAYELTDHLGNVRAVVSDQKLSSLQAGTLAVQPSSFRPALSAYYNYYPFGMMKPGQYGPGNGTVNSGYRFGFNGQEKSDDISRGHFTAEFWEYDSRTARRWELDPVSKPWQSNYSVLSNSPIWKVDPDGADDIFSARGNFVRHVNNKTNYIMIEQRGSQPVRIDHFNGKVKWFNSTDDNNRQMMANVVKYYATRAGVYGQVGVATAEDDGKLGMAHFNPKDKGIWVLLKDGYINKSLANSFHLMSALEHENSHKEDDARGLPISFVLHASVYTRQMKSDNFANLSEGEQIGTAINMLGYLQTAKNKNQEGWMDVLNDFNATNRGGIRLEAHDSGGIRIFNKAGGEIPTPPISKEWPQTDPY